jgi:hypothetical protein
MDDAVAEELPVLVMITAWVEPFDRLACMASSTLLVGNAVPGV